MNQEFNCVFYFSGILQEVCAFIPKNEIIDQDEKPLLEIKEKNEGKTAFAQLIAQKTVSEVPKLGKGQLKPSTQVGLAGAQVIRDVRKRIKFFFDDRHELVS